MSGILTPVRGQADLDRSLWLVVELAGRLAAIPHMQAGGSIESLGVTPVPFAPAAAEGLIATAGGVFLLFDGVRLIFPQETCKHRRGRTILRLADGQTALRIERSLKLENLAEVWQQAIPRTDLPASTDLPECVLAVGQWQGRSLFFLDLSGPAGEALQPCEGQESAGGWVQRLESGTLKRGAAGAVLPPRIEFLSAGLRLALEPGVVREIVEKPQMVDVPGADPLLPGVIILRGKALAALDPGVALHRPSTRARLREALIVTLGGTEIAILAEGLAGLRRYAAQHPAQSGDPAAISSRFTTPNGNLVLGLTPDRLLPADRLQALVRVNDHALQARDAAAAAARDAARCERLLILSIGGEPRAIPVAHVIEVLEDAAPTRLPGLAAAIAGSEVNCHLTGMLVSRGEIIPLVVFDKECPEGSVPVVVLESFEGRVALAIDSSVAELCDVPLSAIHPADGFAAEISRIARLDARLIPVLDPQRLSAGQEAAR